MTTEAVKDEKITIRPPIVVVMGHIDHGKTKILDWYRKTKIVEQESGGITQHIGAYEVEHHGKKITFIDTPGHEAFSKMRSRGAKVADLAILVVAADEGLKPQTKEALEIIRQNNLNFVVAINKSDKPEANVERVKQQLAEAEVLVESYGGKIPSVEISAKTGENMEDLLEVLLLLAELEHLETDQQKPGEGVVIEAHLDSRRGITATLLLRAGKLEKGDAIVIGTSAEFIKILQDFLGRPLTQAGPSAPVRVVGLSETPMVGDTFRVFASRTEAEDYAKSIKQAVKEPSKLTFTKAGEETKPIFNLIVKADVVGSKEVLEESLKKIESETIGVNIFKSDVGNINESDVKLATATKLVTIVGFKVKVDAPARELAERSNVRMVTGEVIYEVLDEVKRKMREMIPPTINRLDLGKAKILKVFKREGAKQVVGGRVEEGIIRRGAKINIKHFKEIAGSGIIIELQQAKRMVDEAPKGAEFGILAEAKTPIQEGDVLDIFEEQVVKGSI
jgi:translation initiation factor IF-2